MKTGWMVLLAAVAVCGVWAEEARALRTGPWTKEQAWTWYNAQPWIRGCNYMPASAANRVDQWQSLGAEARFAEVERELFAARFRQAGGSIDAEKRPLFGHHPHGVDPDKTGRIVNFFCPPRKR